MIYFDKNVGQVHFSRGQLDPTVGAGLGDVGTCWHKSSVTSVHVLHRFLSLSLTGDGPLWTHQTHMDPYTSWHRWFLKGDPCHLSLSLITLLPASSKDGVFTLLLSLLF